MSIEKKPKIDESSIFTVIYIRTSTKEQNPISQLENCESIRPKKQNYETFVEYKLFEEEASAWKEKERPKFDEIIRKIKKRKIRNLIVWDLDRIYRNRKKLLSFFKLCKHYNCRIYSYRQNFLQEINKMPSPWDEILYDMMIQIFGWIAEEESNRLSDRIKKAVVKGEITKSYKGNKWGRKKLSTFKKRKIKELYKKGHSYRDIEKEVKASIGSVHKTISEIREEKT